MSHLNLVRKCFKISVLKNVLLVFLFLILDISCIKYKKIKFILNTTKVFIIIYIYVYNNLNSFELPSLIETHLSIDSNYLVEYEFISIEKKSTVYVYKK
jgi:hypothetical protein